MSAFAARYAAALSQNHTRLCVGLDTDARKVPETVRNSANPALEFNLKIIEATQDLCCAYKPNLAFYESDGARGMEALQGTVASIPSAIIKIGDAKRGDIGNTAEQYAAALFDTLGFDAVTVSPYLGTDSLAPFFGREDRCVFVLALTSNPGSAEFQRKVVDGRPLFLHVIDTCLERFGSGGGLGFVVGATHPDELASVRAHVGPDIPLLIPGLGAQGGDAAQVAAANAGGIAFINVSRGITSASRGSDYADRAREAARSFVDQLREPLPA